MKQPPRRIVTGHDDQGRAIFQEDGLPPRDVALGTGEAVTRFYEVWNTQETPARIDRASGEPAEDGIVLAPPTNGTRIRIVDFPPEDASITQLSAEEARERFAEVGAGDASKHGDEGSPHPLMHRTETVDYGIVMDGEITLILDTEERTVRAGGIVIQRGTNHGWANRSGEVCRVVFVLIDGSFEDGLG
ncbi:cupin domain-containing protein [Altererythrobacter sp. ZODW24]|uniref:cupin domain-containing protein n=1 Tax=Altererythrobacter sp. ZODW24 TaxID=2185142 RepID=UPI000DF7C964|nr:cupin domain-containing protein [Altererythrobacter sp. ZODW24]